MNKADYTNYSIEELKQKEKQSKVLAGLLVGMLLVLLVFLGYRALTKGFNALIAVPFALLPIVINLFTTAKNIRKEIESRQEK
ncbi:hypothetical protein HX057_15140 [Myroides odoratimimus]|uniref:Redox-active disulfide protein 2 n=1 Tax=Myroides odoratimimus CCUG 10230 TaxID=883150 RepID=A0ABN0MN23_9FLAO|nr:hypothetical protein [Myroides odoratimimus]EPC08645.1 hypothetical protein HMPREF9712_03635 [Myroides odoratimimus CCUG 10230]EPC08699.1 hypothetical protein HMPREF9712_03603 [Myroides odoratimimus CCUG 10230]MDM1097762.1 hypothetical protein [Myroides odoratimimus]MDM1411625.1 hypothetical protein [Myroides odoratimimus]MDM1415113.1 hypothetical protein [Myroides odoratimimus]